MHNPVVAKVSSFAFCYASIEIRSIAYREMSGCVGVRESAEPFVRDDAGSELGQVHHSSNAFFTSLPTGVSL
jgi:hypothetical protein